MFGYLRFILAVFVMLSHLDIRFYGLNQGVIAVVIFYILAGYVVSYLYTTIIPKQIKNKKSNYSLFTSHYLLFIKDRVRRIFPLYLFILFLTVIFILITNFGKPQFTSLNIFTNLTIIPLNFYMLLDNEILTNPKWWLIPPAWSLGTELQAYLLLPFAIVFPKIKYILISISLLIYILADFTLIHPDYFGYRLIVGVFFIFLSGTSLQKISSKTQTEFDTLFLIITWSISIILITTIIYLGLEHHAYARETAIGLIVGIPLIYMLSLSKKKLPLNRFLGSLSYGIFLSHFLAIWIVKYLKIDTSNYLYIISISLVIGLIGVFLEKIYIKKV